MVKVRGQLVEELVAAMRTGCIVLDRAGRNVGDPNDASVTYQKAAADYASASNWYLFAGAVILFTFLSMNKSGRVVL